MSYSKGTFGRRIASLGMVLVVLLAWTGAASASATETYRDEFTTKSYSGNNGTFNWSTNWTEIAETDGPGTGDIRADDDSRCATGPCLVIGKAKNNDAGIWREADLAGAKSATLMFDYQRHQHESGDGYVRLAVSGNGGANWSELAAYAFSSEDGGQIGASFDISAFTSVDTRVRFLLFNSTNDDSHMNVDNLQITGEFNEPPVLDPVGDKSVNEQSLLGFTATASDSDAGDTVSFSVAGAPEGASIGSSSGAFTWTPSEAQGPGSYTFDVVVTDDAAPAPLSDSETITVIVAEVNEPPVLDFVGDKSIDEGSILSFSVSASDPDPGNSLSFSLLGAPAGASIGSMNGIFSWTPDEVQGPGSYNFEIKVTDDGNPTLSDTASITLTVDEVNRPPNLTGPGSQVHTEGNSVSLSVIATDPDAPANALAYSARGLPPGVSINPSTGLISGTIAETASGVSPYMVTLTVGDGNGGTDTDTFPWTITAATSDPNRRPVLAPIGPRIIDELTTLTFNVTAADPDGDTLTYSLIAGLDPIPRGSTLNAGTGLFTWTPTEAQGPGIYRFRVMVTDNGNPNLSSERAIVLTVSEVNTAPNLLDPGDQYSLQGETVSLPVSASDLDIPVQTLTFTATGLPPGLAIDPKTGHIEGAIEAAASTVVPYGVTINATDDISPASVASVDFTWTITTPTQPIGHSATYETFQSTPINILLTGTHPAGLPISYTIVAQPGAGSLTGITPNVVYTPQPGAVGPDSFTFTVSDGTTTSPPATITVLVMPPNRPPLANPDNFTTSQRQPLHAPAPGVLGNDSDPDDDPLTATLDSGPNHGTLTLYPDGRFTYTPDPSYSGTDSFTYIATDTTGAKATTTVIIMITSTVKTDVVVDITSLERTAVTEITEPPTINRTLVLMARATTGSVRSMGFPLILLGLLGGSMLTLGRITLLPVIRRGDIATGIVRLYDPDLQYGLITSDDPGPDLFFHQVVVRPKHGKDLTTGNRVQYRVATRAHRDIATTVRLQPTTQESTETPDRLDGLPT